jgi:putative ABC transport system permease protein
MALGIGASTAVFSVLDHILLRPLPLPQAERLVLISDLAPTGDSPGASYANYLDYATRTDVFESSAAWNPGRINLQVGTDEPQRLIGLVATSTFLQTLGLAPQLGRDFRADDELAGPDAVLISDRLWRERFAADPSAIGRSVLIEGGPGTIVGVLPPLPIDASAGRRFGVGLFPDPDLITPFKVSRVPLLRQDRSIRFLAAVARLRPGVTAGAAESALRALLAHIPDATPAVTGWSVQVTPLQEAVVGESRPQLLLLGAAVALLLLACCVNVAGMLLARSSARQRDFAIRAALGASRGRIAFEVLAEALLLGLVGGAVGLLLSVWSLDALVGLGATDLPRLREVRLDLRVALIGIAIAIAAGAASGLWPALQASRGDPAPLLQEGAHSTASRRSGAARNVLVVVEIALASLLVLSTGLLLRSLARVLVEPPGAKPEGLVVMRFGIGPPRYNGNADNAAFAEALLTRVSVLPEVESASSTSAMPLDPGGTFAGSVGFEVDDRPTTSRVEDQASFASVMPGFFGTMRIPLLRGRDFTTSDRGNSAPVMIVNETFARRYFPGRDAVSKRVTLHARRAPGAPFLSREIIAVVGDVHQRSLDEPPPPTVYLPELQDASPNFFVVVRTAASALRIGPSLRAQVRAIDSTLGITRIYALKDALASSTQGRRFQLTLLGFFAATALLLAALGVYGVMAYSVVQRTREFGIRLALGATAADIRRIVLGRTLMLCCAGLALGVLGSAALSRLLAGALFGIGPLDPITCAIVALLLFSVALCAGSIPTRRAARLSPLVALKA